MRISVIISTYTKERYKDVLRCLESLYSQTREPDEIILVLDPVEDIIDFYEKNLPYDVEIVESYSFGLSAARNTGIKKSRGDIIAFIDDDAWADKFWLEKIEENFKNKHIFGVGGRIIPVFESARPKWLAEELDWIVGCTFKPIFDNKKEIRNPIGANMAFRREVFDKVGLFREKVGRYGKKLLGGEETDLAIRIRKKYPKAKIVYEPGAIVYHRVPKHRTTLKYVIKRAFYEGHSKAILAKEHSIKGEYEYLLYLIKVLAVKTVKLRFHEIFGKLIVISSVGVGNLIGKIKR